ncbi:MAG: choice-of-anchor L domain-containing protein, partial [Planctomycetes bacterium]|nr:choice-of-anchor L domain-containing protein [Planctomycetota bacterium]
GGNGGVPGGAFGAGIYIADWASADVKGTVVENCEVIGGLGGNGGDRAGVVSWSYGGGTDVVFSSWDWHWWPLQGDPIQYTGKGGGVYCGFATNVHFTDCMVTGNTVRGSVTGVGEIAGGIVRQEPTKNYQLPGYGAGVYCDDHTHADFDNCYLKNNMIVDNPAPAGESADTLSAYFINEYIGYGGGICLDGLHVANNHTTIKRSQFTGNYGSVGGGIFASGSDIDVQDCNFIDQIANLGGGMFTIDSLSDISRCVITGNAASSAAMGIDTGDPDSQGEGLISGAGGGIYSFTTKTNIADCMISGNTAGDTGGGLYLGGDPERIFPFWADAKLKNCLVTNNIANRYGGGVSVNWFGQAGIYNSTIADNKVATTTGYGGGLDCAFASYAEVKDSIIWGNLATDGAQIAVQGIDPYVPYASLVDVSYSIVGPEYDAVDGAGQGVDHLVVDLTDDPSQMISTILGEGVTASNFSYTGGGTSSGIFRGGIDAGLGIESGVILTCGNASYAPGFDPLQPGVNISDGASASIGGSGDADLEALIAPTITN